jgi:hypothetical protein
VAEGEEEGRMSRGGVFGAVDGEFYQWQATNPVVLVVVDVGAKHGLNVAVLDFGLAVGFSASAASGTCPTDNGLGVVCSGATPYYCLAGCKAQTQCPSWTGTICATGITCPTNCATADSCGYCNTCSSGFTLCGSYPTQSCTANTTVPANCSSYNQCTATCSACSQGFELSGNACVGATLKLGSDSVGALSHIFQSTNPYFYLLSSGNVGKRGVIVTEYLALERLC